MPIALQLAINHDSSMKISSAAATIGFVLMLTACTAHAPVIDGSSSSSSSSAAAEAIIESPASGATIQSPVVVSGKAKGFWFFEASLPVSIEDDKGAVLVTVPAQAEGEWMTVEYVDFSVSIPFSTTAKSGFIVVSKDNPSGDPERDASVRVPVTFK